MHPLLIDWCLSCRDSDARCAEAVALLLRAGADPNIAGWCVV